MFLVIFIYVHNFYIVTCWIWKTLQKNLLADNPKCFMHLVTFGKYFLFYLKIKKWRK